MDVSSYRITLHERYHSHTSLPKRRDGTPDPGRPYAKALGGWYLWPNLALEVYPGGTASLFHVMPAGPERSLLAIEWYGPEPTAEPRLAEAIEHLHRGVRAEDVAICESVQRGLRNRGYAGGRFVIDPAEGNMSEHAVHHFQAMVLRALGE
jgi:phenylpropionate dioxygenase-like ring-hydroxylating dioxygenase large terminal subunit